MFEHPGKRIRKMNSGEKDCDWPEDISRVRIRIPEKQKAGRVVLAKKVDFEDDL